MINNTHSFYYVSLHIIKNVVLCTISNKILMKYEEMDVVETISVMNMASKTVFLGSLKVFNYEVIPNVMRDLEKDLKGYGQLVVRDQKVTPCCSPSYTHISFNVTISKPLKAYEHFPSTISMEYNSFSSISQTKIS